MLEVWDLVLYGDGGWYVNFVEFCFFKMLCIEIVEICLKVEFQIDQGGCGVFYCGKVLIEVGCCQ